MARRLAQIVALLLFDWHEIHPSPVCNSMRRGQLPCSMVQRLEPGEITAVLEHG